MQQSRAPNSVLIVSSTDKMTENLTALLPAEQFSPAISVASAGEARRMLVDMTFDLVIINTPLTDDFGAQLAIDIARQERYGILLLVKSEYYEQISYQVEEYGILTIQKPNTRQAIYSAVKMLSTTHTKLRAMENQTTDLKVKMEEIKLVNRAKWLLVDRLKMSEPDAHRFIEKQAMDRCLKKREIAVNIIKTYDDISK